MTNKTSYPSILDQNLDIIAGALFAGGDDSEDDEDLSHLPPELKQLREKERRSANNAREVIYDIFRMYGAITRLKSNKTIFCPIISLY